MINLLSLASLGVVALASAIPQEASAQTATIYRYCMQPSAPWGPDCAYVTIEQCRAAASAVGFCYENPRFLAASQGRPRR
jgi:Protein of unknown function (DUF3551)